MRLEDRITDIKGKNILLLQGPMGDFFNKLDNICTQKGAFVTRIGFNAGDAYFSKTKSYFAYKGRPKQWAKFINKFYQDNNIDIVFLFGDCRFYHKIAIKIAKGLGIDVYVFEEGYLRPGFITMEYYGVNNHSRMPRDREFYDNYSPKTKPFTVKSTSTYGLMAWWATQYYLVSNIFYFLYPHYIHHRDFSPIKEGFYGIRNLIRKIKYKFTERDLNGRFEGELSEKYYFVALQTHDDFQVRTHSRFRTMESFIEYIISSFSRYAPKDTILIFKHHPMDRGKKNYNSYIRYLAKIYRVDGRIMAVFDAHLPTIIKNSKAVILINSTVGLNALSYSKPVICLGKSMYDIKGLTTKDLNLDKFWSIQSPVDKELYSKFRAYLIDNTQITGSYYLKDGVEFK
ncbi:MULTISPECIES: capsule biosynthesis protein [Campylobacter]|uniref:capsule biosynthesis protein n=1 Tax=Campylobacter TaxID=194 RepID=UPI000A341984|nr:MULTISPECIES: capsular biosynthesis protein [unclassified Campylobacter]MCR8696657.1 capsular biosynthesis protein [Campylobacter sp. RM19073]